MMSEKPDILSELCLIWQTIQKEETNGKWNFIDKFILERYNIKKETILISSQSNYLVTMNE